MPILSNFPCLDNGVESSLSSHIADKNNPHGVDAEQTGAIPATQKGAAGGVAELDSTGKVPSGQLPEMGGKRMARFTVGTSTSGWTAGDCDYLCDGTDDQIEINAAIQALPSTGGEIVILDGTYNITATIAMNKGNVKLSGNGTATVLKRMWDSFMSEGVIAVTTVNGGCCIENLQVDGNQTDYTQSVNCGISISSSGNNNITGNTCNNNSGYGISISSSENNNITGNTCNNNQHGILLSTNTSNNAVTGNICNNNSYNGITLSNNTDYESNNNKITGNTCNNNSECGISMYYSDNNTVTGNTCNNNYNGISLDTSHENTITGNNFNENNSLYGVGIQMNTSYNNTITGNTCNNNSTGIQLLDSRRNTVAGNTFIRGSGYSSSYTSGKYTIYLSGTGNSYNLIACNNIMGKNYISDGGTSNTFVDNKYN